MRLPHSLTWICCHPKRMDSVKAVKNSPFGPAATVGFEAMKPPIWRNALAGSPLGVSSTPARDGVKKGVIIVQTARYFWALSLQVMDGS